MAEGRPTVNAATGPPVGQRERGPDLLARGPHRKVAQRAKIIAADLHHPAGSGRTAQAAIRSCLRIGRLLQRSRTTLDTGPVRSPTSRKDALIQIKDRLLPAS